MILLRRFILFISFLSGVTVSAQNCAGDFNWGLNGDTVLFFGTTSPNINSIVWDFGDGNYDYSNSTTPTHFYSSTGIYTVCMICSDTMNNCTDTTCHAVNVNPCYATFNFMQSGYTAYFTGYANGSSPYTVYQWNFGCSNATSAQQNTSYTYPGPGTYNVCFAYYDTTTGCADSICAPVDISSCNADFTYIDSLGYVFFINTSTLGSSGVYFWDFGDGNYSSQESPSHTYSLPGTYLVCLTAYDSLQNFCDSTCHYITVTNVAGAKEMEKNISNFSVVPNPSNGNCDMSFNLSQPSDISFCIVDCYGKVLKEISKENFAAGKQIIHLNTSDFSSGVYFIKATVNDKIINTKMIVSH